MSTEKESRSKCHHGLGKHQDEGHLETPLPTPPAPEPTPIGRLGLLDFALSFITSWYFETQFLSLLHMDGQIMCCR